MKLVPLLACSLCAAFASTRAEAQELKAIVLTGSKLPAKVADAEAIKKKLVTLVPAAGFPKLYESKSIEGLKPGFEVLVLGFCPYGAITNSIADLIEAEAKRKVPGTYGKLVTGVPVSCPTLKIDKPEDSEEGAKLYAAYLKNPKSADALAELGHFFVSIGDLDAGEYLGLQALSIDAKHDSAKGLLQKIGVLRAD
jgi:hypothetical protein